MDYARQVSLCLRCGWIKARGHIRHMSLWFKVHRVGARFVEKGLPGVFKAAGLMVPDPSFRPGARPRPPLTGGGGCDIWNMSG